ncbi:MAG: hypothetical protein ACRD0E_03495, partial [Acidimicrobiales bacterium]
TEQRKQLILHRSFSFQGSLSLNRTSSSISQECRSRPHEIERSRFEVEWSSVVSVAGLDVQRLVKGARSSG